MGPFLEFGVRIRINSTGMSQESGRKCDSPKENQVAYWRTKIPYPLGAGQAEVACAGCVLASPNP